MSERRRVLHVVHSLVVGGAERVICDLMRTFDPERIESILCCLDSPGPVTPEMRAAGFRVHTLYRRPGLDLKLIRRLRRLIIDERIDVVHAHQYTPYFYSVLAARLTGVSRIVFTEHGRFYPDERKTKRVIANQLLHRITDEIVAISAATRESLIHIEAFPPERVRVVYNGIDTRRYQWQVDRVEQLQSLGIPDPSAMVIGTVARFDPIKNLGLLIRAFGGLLARFPTARLLLVGDGPVRGELEQLVRQLELEPFVVFTGIRRDVPELLPVMDVFVLPSLSEGTSITLLEAMASGVPVVATAVGGNPEIVQDDRCGFLVPNDDEHALRDSLERLLGAPELRRRMGEAGRERVHQHFSLEQMVRQYGALYGFG